MVISVYWLLTVYGERVYGYQCVLVTDRVWRERDTASGASRCLPFYRGLNLSLQHHFCILPVNNKTDQTIKSHKKLSQKQKLIQSPTITKSMESYNFLSSSVRLATVS